MQRPANGAAYDVLACPSNITAEQCSQLQDAINNLLNHSDSFCRSLGSTILTRFNNNEILYDPNTSYYGYMYVTESNIYLGAAAFWPGELANTLAHEESHFMGYEDLRDGSWNDAYAAGDRCAGTI